MQNRRTLPLKETVELLNAIPIFDSLNHADIRALSKYLGACVASPGDTIFSEGAQGDAVYFIAEGNIEIVKTSSADGEAVIARLGRGRSLGEMAIVDDYSRSATARAVKKTVMAVLTKEMFELVLEDHPAVGVKILRGIARQLSLSLRMTSSTLADFLPATES